MKVCCDKLNWNKVSIKNFILKIIWKGNVYDELCKVEVFKFRLMRNFWKEKNYVCLVIKMMMMKCMV